MKAVSVIVAVAVLLAAAPAWAQEPLAVLTEIQIKRGKVEVKTATDPDWQAPKPLLSLRAGDQVRVTGEGRAVLVFTGGRGTQLVTQSNSPFTVQAQAGDGVTDRARAIMGGVTNFLLGQQREKTYQSLSVRSVRAQPPVILAPRDSRVLPGGLSFEWTGSDRLKYRVRLLGPQGTVLWEQAELDRKPLAYPAGAPALSPGVRYTWELETKEHGVQRASFDLAQPADAARVKEALASLTPAAAKGYPPATLSLMRAGLLFQETLYADARRELIAAIAASPDEPTLHLLLGHVYDRTGLKGLAANEFDEAEALTTSSN
ncbi:MAG TPA: hypothetical protein VMQ51_12665 [Candidatus Binatia bacterium]|nr:hypothetical protein [Candidatus Binatia bacterium]